MKNFLIAAAMSLALAGCAASSNVPTTSDTAQTTGETSSQTKKTRRVCSSREESSTGSRLKKRTCRNVTTDDADGA